jgi:hypothetical protein
MKIGAHSAAPVKVVAAAQAGAPSAPVGKNVKATIDPLPKFAGPDDYKIYGIRLTSEAIVAQGDLTRAQKNYVNGTASIADVNAAARQLNDVRNQIRAMQAQPSGFKALIWSWFKHFNKGEFWKSQGLDLTSLAVRPKAVDLIASIQGPTAEALKAAVAAMDKGDWEGAQQLFKKAAELASTQKEALVTGRVAAGLRFDVSADNAFKRAVDLSATSGEATEVATEAASFTNYKYNSANYALRKGADLAKSKEQALKVADRASSLGYTDAAAYAAARAAELK